MGADSEQYFIKYDYENSGDRYFSLDDDDADGNSDGGTDTTGTYTCYVLLYTAMQQVSG